MSESLEMDSNQESVEKPIELTQQEFWTIQKYSFPENDEEKQGIEAILNEKGITKNSGNIMVSVDGRVHTITTKEKDFGTIVSLDNAA